MNHHIFCYGTLMFTEVFEAVAGVAIEKQTCVLPGYERLKLNGQVYPAIREKRHTSVPGVLYRGLSQSQLHRLDQYEGDEYLRELVMVRTHLHRYYSAWVYVLQPKYNNLLSQESWDPVEFERLYL
ncbi:MAG: gamma-glutamylcyclotransferase, partial [Gammaproteobacteria bacterium]|nr:gamma-glutamylcyclotransferase [Gammaproteobacteria bacterium]